EQTREHGPVTLGLQVPAQPLAQLRGLWLQLESSKQRLRGEPWHPQPATPYLGHRQIQVERLLRVDACGPQSIHLDQRLEVAGVQPLAIEREKDAIVLGVALERRSQAIDTTAHEDERRGTDHSFGDDPRRD